jgi:hypothetical protein
MSLNKRPPEPWLSFFDDIDSLLTEPVRLHCFGGFVTTQVYGVVRMTSDVDFISTVPVQCQGLLSEIAGKNSVLHGKHKIYLDPVTIANAPENYESRLRELFAGTWMFLRLYALEAHDLVLAKLERGFEVDREDVQQLARGGHLNRETLLLRYREELRPYLVRESWHDQTLQMWIDVCWP